MRVVAGSLRGRRLALPASLAVRPTSERVREAIFSSLTSRMSLKGAQVLDLYAGSGLLGIEAISRGARAATFVEQSREVAAILRKNLAELGLDAQTSVIEVPVERFLARRHSEVYGVVFADPPYDESPGPRLVELVRASALVGDGSILVIEGRASRSSPWDGWSAANAPGLSARLLGRKRYSDTEIAYIGFSELDSEGAEDGEE